MKRLENKGITLVALVVTIIVLIILAGVSISLVLGQDGVVQKAKQGRDNYAEAARLENEQLANVDAFAMDIEAMIPSTTPEGTVSGTITNMTDGDIEIAATVNLEGNIDLTKTKYAFTTSNTPLGTSDETLYKDGIVEQANGTVKATKKAGTYYLHVLAADINGAKTEIVSEQTAISQGKKNFDYTGSVQDIVLTPGRYKLEVWGAKGGCGYQTTGNYIGGKGGYSVGTVTLNNKENIYIYSGGAGTDDVGQINGSSKFNGGFNGGGFGCSSGGGGGASDIRIGSDSLYARVIVAGGGGGGYAGNTQGGYGGGTSGGGSYPGTQTGSSGNYTGSFGQGADVQIKSSNDSGGGAGGWYGGGSYGTSEGAGGGGSGYVYTSSTASNYPSGCLLNSSYYLTDAQTIAGNTSFTAPTGSSETGHSGNGYARITALD